MNITIQLFATLRDRAGERSIDITVDEPVTVERVLGVISAEYPALAPALPSSLVAVNRAFADSDTRVNPGDEFALFPPVSGG
jgi:MoaD family protein